MVRRLSRLDLRFRRWGGRFVVQDSDHIIRGADRKEGTEYMVHDIFTEQPVIGR